MLRYDASTHYPIKKEKAEQNRAETKDLPMQNVA